MPILPRIWPSIPSAVTCRWRTKRPFPRPIRIFHGAAADWTPIGPCQAYVDRLQAAGLHAVLFACPGAHHGFDNPGTAEQQLPTALSPRRCTSVEQDGQIVDGEISTPS
ncbi:MAG: hypothetical protein KC425_15670, partial [Anaerolineales bacterium]|nr:hypothetical protein [Anaerolineales bacterium]